MRKFYALAIALLAVLFVNAQINVTVTGSSNTTPALQASYTSIATALTDLNAVTAMTGPVTLTLAAGSSETAPVSGFTVGSTTLNPVLSSTNTVTIIKASGAATVLNAGIGTATPSSAAPDGILKLVGSDYVTVSGLTFTDGNAANPATMEFGLALFKLSASDGCQNNTIQNCIFNMQRINNASSTAPMVEGAVGILVVNSIPTAATTVLTPTAASGTNSSNKFYSNTINGGNYGIALSGFAATTGYPLPPLGDVSNDVGGTGASSATTGNTILNYGGGASTNPAAAIRANNQWGINISNNTINNNDGTGVNHATTLRGIYAQAGTSANVTISYNTVTVNSAATTSALTAIENAIGSTANSNTVSITNNIIQNCTYTTATTATFTAITNTATAAVANLTSNQVLNNNIGASATASSCTFIGVFGSGTATNTNINSNTVSGNSVLNSFGAMQCVRSGSSITTINGNTVTNNGFPNNAGATSSTLYGVYDVAAPTTENYTNNIINNLSITGSGTATANAIYGIYNVTSGSSTVTVSGNNVNNLSFTSSGAGSATVAGIRNAYGSTVNVFKNVVHTLSSTGATPTVAGIYAGSTTITTINVYNNLVGNLSTPASTGANLHGLYAGSAGTNLNFYYNTVYLNATSTGTNFGSSAIFFSSTTPTVTIRNNILVNTSTATGTGLTTVIRRTATALTSYGTTSDNNLLYAGTPSASNLIYYDGTNADQTLPDFKARVTPRETSSVTENPPFLSTTGSSANFLHINTAVATQIESGGTPVTGITDDFDGNTRNATTPDIGADEGNFILSADQTPPTITYTLLAGTCTFGDRTLTATIVDAGGIPTAGSFVPRVYFRKNNGTWQSAAGTLMSGNGSNGTWDFVIAAAALGGVTNGDVISYYVIAQDNAATPNISSNPTGVVATNVNTVSTHPSNPNIYGVGVTSGTFTVGSGGNFSSLTNAVAVYNAGCITGNIVYNLTDANYGANETFPIVIDASGNGSSTATLTIKPAAGVTSTITGSVNSGALIRLNGADYVTIDGSNNGTTSRDLTITNTNTTAPTAIAISSLGTGAGATFNTIKNLNLSTGTITTGYSMGIAVGGTTPGTTGADNDNNSLQNNNISGATLGVFAYGLAAATMDNLAITGNTINTNATLDTRGLWLGYGTNSTVSKNIISVETSGTSAAVGISIETGFINSSINGNQIIKSLSTNTGGYGGRGITIGTGTATSGLSIANNMISGVNGTNWSSFGNSSAMGIAIGVVGNATTLTTTAGGINLYHNSISLTGNFNAATNNAVTTALYIGSAATSLDIRNNIFANALVNTSTTNPLAKAYSIYSAAANTAFTTIDYNNYFVAAPQGVLGYIGSDRADLTAIQAGFGGNVNSKNIQPVFVSASDLHLVPGQNALLDNLGTPVGITTDIDNDTRSATTPDMGADEFSTPGCAGAVGGTISAPTVAYCGSGTPTITATGFSSGLGSTYQWQSSSDGTNFTDITGQTSPSALTLGSSITATTYYRLKVTCTSGTAIDYSNVLLITINPLPTATINPAVPVILCAPATQTLTAATNATTPTYQWKLNGTNITGATNATYVASASGSYTVLITASVTGCNTTSAAVNVTINPLPGVITLIPTSAAICAGTIQQITASVAGSGLNVTSGTGANTTTGNSTAAALGPNPMQNYYGGDKVQMLFTASELTTLGLASGSPVSAIKLNLVTADATYALQALSVKMKNTSTTALSTAAWETGLTTVKNAANYTPSVGLNTLTLDNPFTWDGTSNLAIEINYSNNNGGTSGSTYNTALHSPTTFVSTTMYRADNVPVATTDGYTATANFSYSSRNDITFVTSAPAFTWSPVTGLYTDAAATVAYTAGSPAAIVYAKPLTTSTYTITATSTAGCTSSNTLTVTVNAATVITTQPTAQAACLGGNATFTVAATGSGTVTYQWRKAGVNITGATNATYTITGVVAGDAANYDVVVTGGCGSVTSNAVALTVNATTVITTQPTAQAACIGGNATFTVAASGGGTTTYQWRKAGVNITGATSATYTITGVVAGDAANYDVVVTSSCGSVTSNAVALTLNAATSITTQPVAQTACAGSNATFTIVGAGSGTLTYQWRKAGVNITGATNATYTITGVVAGDAANYDVAVTGTCGSVVSTSVTLTVNAVTSITTQPTAQSACAGTSSTFTVVGAGSGTLTYQWRKAGVNITGATSASYTIAAVTAADAANYDVVVTGTCGSVTSTAVALTVNPKPVPDFTFTAAQCLGTSYNFTNTSTVGSGTIATTVWDFGNTTGSTANNPAYTYPAVGTYNVKLVVTTNNGCKDSVTKAVTVNVVTTITTQPTAQTTCYTNSATFSVTATGTGLTYQWRKAGAPITGATASSYTLTNAGIADAVNYDVVVTGTCGTVTSNAVALNVTACTSVPNVNADITGALLMPNLVQQTALLRVTATRAVKINWTVTDMNGRTVLRFDQKANAGQNDMQIQLGQLAAGSYQLNGTTGKGKAIVIRFARL